MSTFTNDRQTHAERTERNELNDFIPFLLKRWTEEKILCMLENLFSPERFATFANDHVTFPTHA